MNKQNKGLEVIVRSTSQLGAALQRFRKDMSLAQNQVSEKSGVIQPAISEIEHGARASRLETIFKLLGALDLEIVIRPRTRSKPIHDE